VKAVDWDTWLEKPGLPPVTADFETPEMDRAQAIAREYISLKGESSPDGFEAYNEWFMFL